jgi:hypothetical protein
VSRRASLYFAIVSVPWGIPYPLINAAADELSPVVVVFARTTIGERWFADVPSLGVNAAMLSIGALVLLVPSTALAPHTILSAQAVIIPLRAPLAAVGQVLSISETMGILAAVVAITGLLSRRAAV